jgi:SAM-dependent methyltransferase
LTTPQFDEVAVNYDHQLNRGLALSGESKDFFIHGRVAWTARRLAKFGFPRGDLCVMDYGCGTGSAFNQLRETFCASAIIGIDVSTAELVLAREHHPWALTGTPDSHGGQSSVDLVYSNGTFHHIPPGQRSAALAFIHRSLKPGGIFALWENNPWNPGTRWVMSRIPFDRDAITLSPPETRRLLRSAGFRLLGTDFLFVFPRTMSFLRWLEPFLCKLPLGGQYLVLAQKPA